jgi:membrane protein DedA with SNARE-associated domain
MGDIFSIFNGTGFSEYTIHYGYIGILIFFITVDQFTPLPEEITLLTIGYLSSNHIFNPILAGIVSLFAFIIVDTLYFFLSRKGNKYIAKKLTGKKNALAEKYKEKLKTHFGYTLIFLCFIPRMRMFGPIFSGLMNLSFKKFLLFDTIGLSAFTTLYITLGYIFHNSLHARMVQMESYQTLIFIVALCLIAIAIFLFIRKRQKDI